MIFKYSRALKAGNETERTHTISFGAYDNSNKFALEDESDPVYNTYKVRANFGSYYNETIQVSEIKLVFSCPK